MSTVSALHSDSSTATTTVPTTQLSTFPNRISRRKVKDFNDSVICLLCKGYLIEATTINDCLHAFCRSCIVRYLESNKFCPKCKSYNNKTITVANLRPDRILKSLVYKLVPGLYKSENQRVAKFYADQCQDDLSTASRGKALEPNFMDDQNFFSPDELISLSLQYHHDSIADYDPKSTTLPVTYLHCPAAVTIHHLYKFILTKNGLQLGNERIQMDIIYEDEILPHEFTLMDVAYCYDYKRVSWMRLFYRIFIRPTAKPMAATTAYSVGSDKNSNENNSRGGASGGAGGGSSGEQNANNSGRNNSSSSSSSSDAKLNESQGNAEPSSSPGKAASNSDCDGITASINGDDFAKPEPIVSAGTSVATVNNKASEILTRTSETVNIPPLEASCYKSVESKYDNKLIITKTNKSDKSGGSEKKEKETLKLVLVSKKSDRNDAKIVYSKSESKSSKSPKQSNPSTSSSFGDFKRLRSNDIRYSDYGTASFSMSSVSKAEPKGGSSSRGGAVPGDDSRKSESQSTKKHNKLNNDSNHVSDSSGKKFSEDNSRNKASSIGNEANIVVPAQPMDEVKSKHEKSKPSPQRAESNGTVAPITASNSSANGRSEKSSELKCYVNLKKQMVVSPLASSVETNRKPEVPKLKIELPSLKTKISIPKSDSERSPKSAHSSSTSSSAATSPTTSSSTSGKSPMWSRPEESVKPANNPQIDIEEYAKTIGLKPVYKTSEGEGKKKKKNSSTSSPDPPSFHRKRKKAKHSKEAGSKRRKLHAEISSQHDESLKMKVKITEKPSKHERKPSEEIMPQSPKEPAKQNTEVKPPSSLPSMSAPSSSASSSSSSLSLAVAPVPLPKEDSSKVIDITKGDDDDDVKIIEQPTLCVQPKVTDSGIAKLVAAAEKPLPVTTRVNELPKLPSLGGSSDSSTKAKINEMRAIRHKPMVYIPNLDKNLSDSSSTINSIIESVQAKTGFIDNDNDVQIVSTSKLDTGNSLPSKLSLPSLVPSKSATTGLSMKPPTMIPSTVNSRTVSTNSFPRPPQRTGAQGPMFSPRHTPSYPTLTLQGVQKKVTVQPGNSTSAYQPRNTNPALKRSTSVDSSLTHNIPPKTPRVDLFESNAQNRLLKKPIYAPMFNFVKGASLAKNGNAMMPTSANDVPYKSPISSTYTKEVNTKTPVPSLLLPPSSISVTKMTDSAPKPSPVDNRPALEIVRIPSTAPVADKPQPAVGSTVGLKSTLTPKTNRPPPPTIPLIKIKKSLSVPEQSSTPISPSIFQVTSSGTKSATKLTTSPASHQDTSGALDLTTRANDDLIILESSDSLTSKLNGNDPKAAKDSTGRPLQPAKQPDSDGKIDIDSSRLELINSLIQTSAASMIKAGSSVMAKFQSAGIPGLKLPADMIGFAITSTNSGSNVSRLGLTYSSASPTATSTVKSIPMPKLAEINRNRNIAVRQPNPSVRSIPNPSALAFRNQTDAISSSSGPTASPAASSFSLASNSSSTITSLSPASPTKLMNVNMRINSANTAGQKPSVNNNGIDTFASGRTYTNIAGNVSNTSVSYNGNSSNNSNSSSSSINNISSRNDSVSSTSGNNNNNNNNNNSGTNGGKKTIEKVAAGLKATAAVAAAAANATNGNRSSSGSTVTATTTSTATTLVVSGGKNGVNVV
ncbi:protein suppressor 2 of zeste-like [Sabethes cyaneus]|uniref:protein suppressor 2 of zeste-like n=1 Tax=Sabethes cyaneus TaxID=53552 RepID=UPI00237E9ACB|nr:protein suppressor 2 of zeste-like [Sabethes cyaneus]XP_053684306.1 protein suppressor 2 of zeste-like [Sabethes cyaneus]XP_053684307.1 protein suppressor 2 of zeste-like [Sabethes cyaneus]